MYNIVCKYNMYMIFIICLICYLYFYNKYKFYNTIDLMYAQIVQIAPFPKSQAFHVNLVPPLAQHLFNEMHVGVSDAMQFVYVESSNNKLSARIF